MVDGMPLRDFFRLLSCGQNIPDIMFYDHVGRRIQHFAPMVLPWPVEYLLAHHSPKHVFGGSRLPSLGTIGAALHSWEHKLRWQLVLGEQSRSPWSFLHSKQPRTKPCEVPLPSCVEEFFHEAKQAFYCEVMRIRHRAGKLRMQFSNYFGIIHCAMDFLTHGPFLALKTDKDGGFCLVQKTALADETRSILQADSRYSEVFTESGFARALLLEFQDVVFSAASFAPISDDEKRSLIGSILQPARVCKASNIFACLKYTVKTHKPDGQVSFRALHSSVNTPLQGAMRFVTFLLKPKLQVLPHLLSSSTEVARKLFSCRVSPNAYLLKIDIKDFFMDGSQSEIATACVSMVEPSWRSSCRCIVEYILNTQYLTTPCFPGKVYKVQRGAGMGLLCSGELCDSAFYKTVEESILPNLHRWGVLGYFRFRDDILVIIDSPLPTLMNFVSTLKARSTVWKLKVESLSQSEVCFLDLRIFKGERWHATKCLDVTIHHKETAQKQILATHSLHPPHTHLSWPKSLVHRIFALCNTRKYQIDEVSRLKRMLADRCGIEHVSLVFDTILQRTPNLASHDHTMAIVSRLIIPYHREWEIGSIQSTLRRVLSRYSEVLRREFNTSVTISIAHTLQQRHLDIQLWNLWLRDHGRRLGTEVD